MTPWSLQEYFISYQLTLNAQRDYNFVKWRDFKLIRRIGSTGRWTNLRHMTKKKSIAVPLSIVFHKQQNVFNLHY